MQMQFLGTDSQIAQDTAKSHLQKAAVPPREFSSDGSQWGTAELQQALSVNR